MNFGYNSQFGYIGRSTSFSPDQISGLEAWYDASQIEGLSDGDGVSQWDDLSGNDYHVIQGTESKQPEYQSSQIYFDGVDDFLSVDGGVLLSQPNTVFAVAKLEETAALSRGIMDGSNNIGIDNRHFLAQSSNQEWALYCGGLTDNTTTDTNLNIFSGIADGVNSLLFLNGNQITSGDFGSQAFEPFTVGSDRKKELMWYGYIAEILFYNQKLSDSERQAIEQYLSDKWGIAI